MSSESFQFWFFSMLVPVVSILIFGAALIVHIVMSQRTKREAIAKGVSPEQYARMSARGLGFKIGVFCCGFGLALLAIGLFRLSDDSPYTWAFLFLGPGGALVLSHFLVRLQASGG